MKLIVLVTVVGLTFALVSGMPQQEQKLENEEKLPAEDVEAETGNGLVRIGIQT